MIPKSMNKQEKFLKIYEELNKEFPDAKTELNYENPYQLAVAVLLAAQSTDKRVNLITPDFFNRFPDFQTLAQAKPQEVYEYIKSITYPNNKSKHLVNMAQKVMENFQGKLPEERDELESLPGIGRKSANVLAAVLFNKPYMPVDTHVHRVSNRIGLVKTKNPTQTERELLKIIPENLLVKAHHLLVLHGRYICKARKPLCDKCRITELCEYYKQNKE